MMLWPWVPAEQCFPMRHRQPTTDGNKSLIHSLTVIHRVEDCICKQITVHTVFMYTVGF